MNEKTLHIVQQFERHRDALMGGSAPNEASLKISVGRSAFKSHVSITNAGLLAIGAMVTSILLSAAAVVWVSTRKLPYDTLPRDLRRS